MRYLALLALLAMPAFATDPPRATATATAGATATANPEATATVGDVTTGPVTVESERQAPSTFISAPGSTAPCVIANGWSVGVPGAGGGRTRARVDADCWQEYLRQAEHERAMDEARMALAREQLAFEREQAQTKRQCSDIATRSLESCNAGEK